MTKFSPPVENWSKMPHELIDKFPEISTVGELKVILYILRHTWGFQDAQKKIAVDEFVNGRKRRDQTRLDGGTGLSKGTVCDGLKRAEAHGFIEVEVDDSDMGRVKKYYSLCIGGVPQEVKNPSPGVQKLTPRGIKIGPPTEKDTVRKIPDKKDIAQAKPAKKSSSKPSRVSAGSRKQKDASPAAAVLQSLTGYYPPRSWKQDVANIIDLDRWETVIKAWVGLGRNPMNVSAMLEHYNENRIPTVKGAKHESVSRVQHEAATPETVAAFRDHFAAKRRAVELEVVRAGAGQEG